MGPPEWWWGFIRSMEGIILTWWGAVADILESDRIKRGQFVRKQPPNVTIFELLASPVHLRVAHGL